MLNLMPFVKISWNSNQIRKQWENRLHLIATVTHEAEYQMVKKGLREVNVFHMSPRYFDKQIEKIIRDGLIYIPSIRSKTYNGFSHRHYPVEELDMDCMVYGVVAKNVETAQKFIDAEKNRDNVTQGKLLGYPKCCSESFQDAWVNKKILDPCYESALNTVNNIITGDTVEVQGNPQLNVMLRYFGIKIIPFFPCNYQCKEAIKTSNVWFNVIKELEPNVAEDVKQLLDMPITWKLNKNIIYIQTPLFKGIVNGYDCSPKNVFWNKNVNPSNKLGISIL